MRTEKKHESGSESKRIRIQVLNISVKFTNILYKLKIFNNFFFLALLYGEDSECFTIASFY